MAVPGIRFVALALSLAVAPSRAAPPSGPVPLEGTAEGHDYRLDPKSGKLLFIAGDYPFKTYFVDVDLKTGKSRRRAFPEYRVLDSFVYLAPADQALVAVLRGNDNLLGSGEEADANRNKLLQVSLEDGKILREIRLAPKASVTTLGKPAWTKTIFLLLNVDDKAFLKTFEPATGAVSAAVEIGDFKVEHAVFLDGSPTLVLDARSEKKARLVTYDLVSRKILKDFPREAGFDALVAHGDDVLAYSRPSGEVGGAISLLNLRDGASSELAKFEGDVESLLAGPGRVFAIAKDLSRPAESNDLGHHPRVLCLIPKGGLMETIPWTSRKGRLFGFDPETGMIYFSATQPSGAWTAFGDKETLLRAARELERRSGQFWGNNAQTWGMIGLVVVILILGFSVKKLRPECKSCG